ncbi:MAG: hypothetical protein ABIJ31_10020 [Pseudomonadota bacterium]
MKKRWIILLIGMLCLAAAGNAAAYFENGKLTAVVYEGTNLTALDLGDLSSMDMISDNQVLAVKNSFSISDVNIAIYGRTPGAGWTQWFATTDEFAPYDNYAYSTAFRNAADNLATTFSISSTSTYHNSNTTIFDSQMHASKNEEGSFAGYNDNWYDGIGKISTGDDHVDMYLYKFSQNGLEAGIGTDYQSVVRIFSDGSVIMNPLAAPPALPVPVPAGIIFLGSGILMLSGIRKTQTRL